MTTIAEWDCKSMKEHYEAVSECCGASPHEYVDGMCGKCNELNSWVCIVCDEDMNNEIYS